ncbi:HD-GYP domain-containing protein [Salisediminibacterium halotolerans]|uniref:HD-GYP domain-containing protein n=2 Tax=Salisediminibacterium halotolerans TaxID=517425 RepID=UPI00131507D5|nr:HD domain-containing phosphohydrolase [Salisediminibacterium halotolerans]
MSAILTIASLMYYAEHVFRTDVGPAFTLWVISYAVIGWLLHFLYQFSVSGTRAADTAFPGMLLLYFITVTQLNPFGYENLWIYLLVYPVVLALGTGRKQFVLWFTAFIPYYFFYTAVTSAYLFRMEYALLLGISFLISLLLIKRVQEVRNAADKFVAREKHQYTLSMFDKMLPVVEMKTRIPRSEIDEMTDLLQRTAKASQLQLREWEAELVSMAHYISRMQLPDHVYCKTTPLSSSEVKVMHWHCYFGHDLVPSGSELERIRTMLLSHHERLDGTGYPAGTSSPDVHAQLLGLVESYMSMRQPRAYRKAYSQNEALAILTEEKGRRFDPEIVDALHCVLKSKSTWTTVQTTIPFNEQPS